MEHLAIMKKSWGLTEKILSGQKKIESRWYLSKRSPWDTIEVWGAKMPWEIKQPCSD
ncbi:MAG: hypothetical protein Q7R84_02240 [bacterium]|nr:hypothetical protein [bacterium]